MSNIIRAVDAHYNLKNFGDAEKYKLAFYPETKALVQDDRAIPEYYECLKLAVSAFFEKNIQYIPFNIALTPSFDYAPNPSLDEIVSELRTSRVGQFVLCEIYKFDPSPIKLVSSNVSDHTSIRINIQTKLNAELFVAINKNDLISYFAYKNSVPTLLHELVHRLCEVDEDLMDLIAKLMSKHKISFIHQMDLEEVFAIFFENLYFYEMGLNDYFRLFHSDPNNYLSSTPKACLNLGCLSDQRVLKLFINQYPEFLDTHYDYDEITVMETLYNNKNYELVRSMITNQNGYKRFSWKIGYDRFISVLKTVGFKEWLEDENFDFYAIEWLKNSQEDKYTHPLHIDGLYFSEENTLYTFRHYMLTDFFKDDLEGIESISLKNLYYDDIEESSYGFIVEENLKELFRKTINLKTLNLSRDLEQEPLCCTRFVNFATMHKGISELYLSNQDLPQNSIGSLISLKQLRILDISYNSFNDINMLISLAYLTDLNVSHNHLKEVECLYYFPALKSVDITGNQIEKVSDKVYQKIETIIQPKRKRVKRTSLEPINECIDLTLPPLKKRMSHS